MTSDRPNGGAAGGPPDEELSWVQRLMLYFTTPLRKIMTALIALVGWFAVSIWGELSGDTFLHTAFSHLYFYAAIFVLAVLFTQGGSLRRPVLLPVDVMRRTAAKHFSAEETWVSARGVQETLQNLRTVFTAPGARARMIGASLWVELGKDWDVTELRHREAARHLKHPVFVHFFVEDANGGTTVTAFSGDTRLAGVWDVLKLSDEMAATAVNLGRDATSDEPR